MANLTTNFVIRPSDNRGMYYENTRRVIVFLPQHENIEDIVGENPLPIGGRFDIAKDYQNADEMKKNVQKIRRM